jgi:hypothetical protein
MFNSIPEGSYSSQDDESDQLIDRIDEHTDDDDQISSGTSDVQLKKKKQNKSNGHVSSLIQLPYPKVS